MKGDLIRFLFYVLDSRKTAIHNIPAASVLENTYSILLIIHEEKTKQITTVKEVWKCDLNYHKIL